MVQRPKFRKVSTLPHRLISAAFLVPASLYAIYVGPPFSLILGGIMAFCILGEWIHLLSKCSLTLPQMLIYGILGTAYLGVSIFWFLTSLSIPGGWPLNFWLLFLVWTVDTGAYVGGKLLRGPKLIPSLSPNKTWSGFIIGISLGTVVSYITSLWLVPGAFSFAGICGLALLAQVGDLLESQAKRWSHLKDSSALIPGHGGVLDRLDSLIAVSFALALWNFFA